MFSKLDSWIWYSEVGQPSVHVSPLGFCLFRATPMAYEVPRLMVESELQLPAKATATPEPGHICDLSCIVPQHWTLNPLSKAQGSWIRILMDISWVLNPLSHNENSWGGWVGVCVCVCVCVCVGGGGLELEPPSLAFHFFSYVSRSSWKEEVQFFHIFCFEVKVSVAFVMLVQCWSLL